MDVLRWGIVGEHDDNIRDIEPIAAFHSEGVAIEQPQGSVVVRAAFLDGDVVEGLVEVETGDVGIEVGSGVSKVVEGDQTDAARCLAVRKVVEDGFHVGSHRVEVFASRVGAVNHEDEIDLVI